MVHKIFYNSITVKTDSNVTNIRAIYVCIHISCTFLLFLIFPSIIRMNFRIRGNKRHRFSFFLNLPNNNISRSVNQSIIKKALQKCIFSMPITIGLGLNVNRQKGQTAASKQVSLCEIHNLVINF